ncbi:MAG: flagellar biosynthetic protein FliO [Proteobacteria bacterium]|nr:flagellar biosynthetic protein FliO [Pseudomonadota bacterium]MBS0555206.1 flagellar biosynthetic protein FliO [Pseudomonadota bacterium]
MAFGLAVVIALLFACLWVIRRLSAPRGSAASALKVLGAVAVGPRERVVLVGLGDKVLVLGVAPGQVRTLHVLQADELPTLAGGTAAAASMKDFPAWLRQAMERRHEP